MPVKSDRWIDKMCREHRMIEPYLPELVRQANGRRTISAGTSSYGYDIRLSAEHGFKIFSPIHAGIVDPKRFDDRTLVDAPLYRDELVWWACSWMRNTAPGRCRGRLTNSSSVVLRGPH